MAISATAQSRGFMEDQHRPTERQYAAIGRVAALWSEVEWAMERMIGQLALVPSLLGFVLTDKLAPDNRIGAIKSLVRVHKIKYRAELVDAETLSRIESMTTILAKIKGDRNFVVHSIWSKASDTEMSRTDVTAAARSGFYFSVGPCERLADIEALPDTIKETAAILIELCRLVPEIDAALLDKLHKRERGNRHLPFGQSTRQFQRRSYAKLSPQTPAAQKKK